MDKEILNSKFAIGLTIVIFFLSLFHPTMVCSQITGEKVIRTIDGRAITNEELVHYLSSQMDSLKIPGLSIAIINNGSIVYSKNLGVKNVISKEPVSANTIFEACSLSKPIFSYLPY